MASYQEGVGDLGINKNPFAVNNSVNQEFEVYLGTRLLAIVNANNAYTIQHSIIVKPLPPKPAVPILKIDGLGNVR